ncbi:MAG: hypothetical protein A2288_03240 [Candidatus Moranbacteria bacterium RIFOXYA12_FULL_44_15]|nr:MAG: hypothetical protein A2288_03240 [Candidatus Moranbacteria bacterium RIFOXYA12_FULL_44_15]
MSKTLAYPPLTGGESFGYICGLRVINRENNILQWFHKSELTHLRTSDVFRSLRQLDIGCPKRQTRKSRKY